MRVTPLLVILAGLSACAPAYQPAPPTLAVQYEAQVRAERDAREREEAARKARQQEELARQVARFYEAYPALKGREKCVARVLTARSPETWVDLAQAALSICLPAEQWVKVFTRVGGRSTFVDPTRVEFRKDNQVTFWALVEVFDDEADFLISRTVVDCDKKFWAVIGATHVVGGQYGDMDEVTRLEWRNVLPNTQSEGLLNTMCGVRTARPAKPASPPARPKPQPMRDTPPKVTPVI